MRVMRGYSIHRSNGQSDVIRKTVKIEYPGRLFITNERIVFLAERYGFDIGFDKLSNITMYNEYIEVFGDLPDGCYGLKVKGDSMTPLIDDGDIVVVDPNRWPKPGDYIVARSELENLAEATVKRYYPVGFDESGIEIFEARPLNTMYATMHSVEQKLVIVGTVCKLMKDL